MGDYKSAIETLEKAARINDSISGKHSLELAKALNNLGKLNDGLCKNLWPIF